ncbi:LuxR C-terminal-related transcriptional regulator [Yersinia intermedia]|uniref:helix-turn-helix domain-containing protein n=1 Tax=Yersinia intermedia TaxID=631 RepID=UPI0022FDF794|nr:LuxR C-terminal-related transcriptional regulator [Yersinia intermedia]MDA5494668.1 LuxR C-terminal-related transcriptional regulator [Yersinia intermedia]
MFNCVIDVKDNYFRHGLSILLNEALREYYLEQGMTFGGGRGEVILRDVPNIHTRLVFVDAANSSFRQSLEQSAQRKPCQSPEVFVVLKSKHIRHPHEMMLSSVTHLLYKDDEAADIKHKIRAALIPWVSTKKTVPVSGVSDDENAVCMTMLTRSERIVIALFEQGFTGKSISQILGKSEKTISGQKRSAMRKLDVHSDVALFRKIKGTVTLSRHRHNDGQPSP